MYPLFKHFLGFLQAYNVNSSLINVCKLCGFKGIAINTPFMKYLGLTSRSGNICYEYNQHHCACPLYNKERGGIFMRREPGAGYFTELSIIK